MKKLVYLAAALALTACGTKEKDGDTATSVEVDTTMKVVNPSDSVVQADTATPKEDAVAEDDNFPAQEKVARELYGKCVFGGPAASVLKKCCTASFLKGLKAANEYEDGGYAVWVLRTGAQDGDGPSKVTSITPDGPDAVIVKYKDMGASGSTRLIFVKEGDSWKVNGATTAKGKRII